MKLFQVDSFTKERFKGNPAGVCIVDGEMSEELMQNIASEMNLSETAFVQASNGYYKLRWFTPAVEVDLCGHATLATAHILWEQGLAPRDKILEFDTLSGRLKTSLSSKGIEMDFPIIPTEPVEIPDIYRDILHSEIIAAAQVPHDLLLELPDENHLINVQPDISKIAAHSDQGVIITAISNGSHYDFISRYFVPNVGIDEDPVTGYAHCVLGDYWGKKLNKSDFKAYQASSRGGEVGVNIRGERVILIGSAITVFESEIF